ncbi:MAG: hypothetical protein GX430_13970 [Treponema sp.]|nr:hypothetical protein [Treponema sp.]
MDRKKILMTMIEVGFGHKAPALAVRDAVVERVGEAVQVDVVDFARECGALKDDRALKDSWDLGLAFPLSARIGYLLVELYGKGAEYIDLLFKDFVHKGIEYIDRYGPDLVFATHPLALYVAVKAKETLRRPFKVVAYVVDPFDGYAWWANEGADALLVASEHSRDRLLRHGVRPEIIRQMGFPINKRFFDIRTPPPEIQRDLDLNPEWPTLLVTAGGQGIGKVYIYAQALYLLQVPVNIIAVAGRNRSTLKRLEAMKSKILSRTRIAPLGYVSNMNELMAASDVVVGKAGASTAMEAAFMGKPFIFTEWATYNDRFIINFALNYHVGWYCPTVFAFSRVVRRIAETEVLSEYKRNLARLSLEPGTDEVADYLLKEAGA